MPFYEYQCKRCGHQLEAMQKVNDAPLRKCPECGKQGLERLMSAPVFRLKGGGWYETDFKSDAEGKKNLAERPESDTAKDDKKAPAASDAKDAKPADTATKEAAPAKDATPAKEDKKAAVKSAAPAKPAARPTTRTTARKAAKTVKKAPARRR